MAQPVHKLVVGSLEHQAFKSLGHRVVNHSTATSKTIKTRVVEDPLSECFMKLRQVNQP